MKKVIFGSFGLVFILLSGWLGVYFYGKSKKDPVIYQTVSPKDTTIIKKTVATGAIVPRREIQIKPQVSGVIQDLLIEAGQTVREGQLVASIRLVPNLTGINSDQISINSARTNMEAASINFRNAEIELARQKKLFEQQVISEQEYNRFLLDFKVQQENMAAARKNLELVQTGAIQRSGGALNSVYSTVTGVVLDVPVKAGSSVIERSNFNEGTTIASVADMQSLVFEGKIDESEVGKIKEGMELMLTIGAIEGKVFKAVLEYISPKGVQEEGAIKFDIRARLVLQEGDYLRAGYSATAEIVLDKREKTLAISENVLIIEKGSTFVEVEVKNQVFERRLIKTGISDGLFVEVLSGLKPTDKVKIPNATTKK
ncbi:efflux RND transporter periplasmic adaptor subunit [Eisenibacter elegans]|jgi:HlyD family secretion protein|uniref:efflux RND transporter periplasmic adaptor subunit n=1 Tax=Eisenibacter elegans TaxID=997 RepID=UPI000409739A|nr:efflux RND transporter periplasmic adaptor subunit [Eisenibacter elegans]